MFSLRIVLDVLFPPRQTERIVRETTREALSGLLHVSRAGSALALLPYRHETAKALILEAKFRDNLHAQELLGEVLASYLHEQDLGESVLVPVPLSQKRHAERGYNQVERICRSAVHKLPSLSLDTGVLVRIWDTRPQTALSGLERRENVHGAFERHGKLDETRTYIVVDDVLTTSATLHEAVSALSVGSKARILAVALAH